jgi:hypothetical protein
MLPEEPRRDVVNTVRARVQQLSAHGKIDLEIAQEFIRESAYWDHPKGSLVRAPKHAEQIYKDQNNDWVVDFGANSFLVGSAIYGCQEALLEFLEEAEHGSIMTKPQLREKLELIVREAVANHKKERYRDYPVNNNNCMMFGTQAINISNFVDLIFSKCGIDNHLF